MIQKFNQALAKDLKEKLEKSNITPYKLNKEGIISTVSLTRVLKAENKTSIPLHLVDKVYKRLGYNEINLSGSGIVLRVKL